MEDGSFSRRTFSPGSKSAGGQIGRAFGVASVVKFGLTPAKVPDEEIAKLIARSDPDGIVRLAARSPERCGLGSRWVLRC
jgi:hypothetical protein